ncbi:hypothetical protein [Aequorivita viscosa]|uniref:Uncharacterized protein n=1 Tax=Aequorivita viscosa TaxID=797419 RepID=A0A1M6M3L9_9FLAO|nr:hypothetical protein [Aequorivita viscosa]SDX30859.1 hypothetical protein SAMN05216556_12418 [Aequorivita viscosa]SHJ78025.1 hypothetical protein SAMN04487908_12542 [Aequorivita viscosa]
MKDTIQKIIQTAIPKECVFDAHSIINFLIKYHPDIYLSSYKQNWTTAYYHSEISKLIATYETDLLKRIGESWSQHINGEFSKNKCWIKL